MKLDDFDYVLPAEAIAQEPLAERDASRLLVLDRTQPALEHRRFSDLPDLLSPGDLVVLNTSRVFPARLLARRQQGGAAELLLLRERGDGAWEAFVRPGRRIRAGARLHVSPELEVLVESEALPPDGRRRVRLLSDSDPWSTLERVGHTPLPPYIRRRDRPDDRERYQTVYAKQRGSVAAPTAGLHFTRPLLARLRERGVAIAEVQLHVGPGTFRPVQVHDVEGHRLEPEPFTVSAETAHAVRHTRERGGRVVAVGTTTTRSLESVALDGGELVAASGDTDLVIVPGHRFRAVDALVTNFHLPRSSLLLLVAAFAGRERVLAAYREALQRGYRFYSYGDAMLIL